MNKLDETALVWALTQRESDARSLRKSFDTDWLKKKEYIPIVNAIFKFMDEKEVVPSFAAIKEYLEDIDPEAYEQRHKTVITILEMAPADASKQKLAVDKAKEQAASVSLSQLIHSQSFQQAIINNSGELLKKKVANWLSKHSGEEEEPIVDIKTATDILIKETPWTGKPSKVPTGILPIDEWSKGGLRIGGLGIIIAPTGGGKSTCLLNIAYNIAMHEGRNVLFLTNELRRAEQTERFLARMQDLDPETGKFVSLDIIQNDPVSAYNNLGLKWKHNIHKRLYIGSLKLNATCEEMEGMLIRLKAEYGFQPDVLVLDYMEKLAPSFKVNREKEWIFLQEIAKELIQLGKSRNCHVWTAVQTNRSGLSKSSTLGMESTQGSVRHLQAADVVVSCRKMRVVIDAMGNQQECLWFAEKKMRSSEESDREMYIKTDLKFMYITKEEIIPMKDTEMEAVNDEDEEDDKKTNGLKSLNRSK